MRALAVLALLALATNGCFRPARAVRDLPPADRTAGPGNTANTANTRYINERVPRAVSEAWSADIDRGLPVAPIIQQDLAIVVVSGGGIMTLNASDGSRYWGRRFNGAVAGQLLRVGSLLYFATQYRNGTAYALDLERGRRIWSTRIGSPAAAEPAYADGRMYLGTNRDMQAIDIDNGDVVWRQRMDGPPAQAPLVVGDELVVAVRDTLFRLDRETGAVRARLPVAGEPSAPLTMRGDTIVIAMQPGIIAAYTERGAHEAWRQRVAAPVLAAPVLTDDGVFVLTRDAELVRVGPSGTRRIVQLSGAATESLAITADGALIGTLDGRLVYVARDGSIVWEHRLDGSIRAPAAVHDSEIYVGTLSGRLVKLTGSPSVE